MGAVGGPASPSYSWWTQAPGYQPPDISAPGFPIKTPDQIASAGAPAGYEWNPVQKQYIRTPTSQGQAVNQYNTAANPALAGLISGIAGSAGSFAGGAAGAGGFGGSSFGGTTTSGSGSPTGSVSGGSYVPQISLPSQQAAAESAFATSKDRAGALARSGLDSLRGELGATGNLGGGAEVQGTKDIIAAGQGQLGQASRDIAGKQADIATDFAKTGYQGAITQRGQDISAQEANARLALEQRQAESQRQLQLMTLALGGLKTAAGVTGYGGTGGGVTGYGGGSGVQY